MKDYLKRKSNEILLLNKYLGKNELCNYKGIKEILKVKEKIIIELRNMNNKKYYHCLTNFDQRSFKSKKFQYNYTYERFNGFISIFNFANDFYGIDKKYKTNTYFTNCGMSAIASVLSSVISSNGSNVDMMYEETYFETIKYISMLNDNGVEANVLYIDTIASNFSFNVDESIIKDYSLIIIDTTCYSGYMFKAMIEKILSYNIPCILIRSHTKLDLLATEYSHIGSISFIRPNTFKCDFGEMFNSIENDCKHLIGVYGACLPPERFPDFMLNKNIIRLNNIRLEKVSCNTEEFVKHLKTSGFNVELPSHKQFCLIYLGNLNCDLDKLKLKIIKFCKEDFKGVPVYHAVSFGFDYIALDCYRNFIDQTFKIRVCLNDLPYDYIEIFEEKFIEFLKKIKV